MFPTMSVFDIPQERDSKKRFERRETMKANSAAKRKERAKENLGYTHAHGK